MKPLLIAFHGLPGVGKDHAANSLLETGLWTKVAFAGPLKRGLSTMFDIPMEDIENQKIKNQSDYKFGRSIRYMLQTLGTEWGIQLINNNVWVEIAEESIEHSWQHEIHVVNTDLRFNNEAEMVKAKGGYIVHIVRPNNDLTDNAFAQGVSNHASNAGIDAKYIDFTITNDKSLEMFDDEIAKLMNTIILKQVG